MLYKISPLWVFLPFGIIPLIYGLWAMFLEIRPKFWRKTTGTIVASKVIKSLATYKYAVFWIYIPEVEYEYDFDGKNYQSNQIDINNYTSGKKHRAFATASHYAAGNSVTVFVKPTDPAISVLRNGVTPSSWMFVLFGLIITAIMLLAATGSTP